MLTLLFIIFLAAAIVFTVLGFIRDEEGWWFSSIFMWTASVGLLITTIVGVTIIATENKIDNQIAMYQEENAKIETQVTETVEKYLEHEYQIFDSLQGEDIQTLLVVYPEINSNELVKRQVEIFVENNNKIKELKEEKLSITTWKFLIYFGR